MLEGPERGQPPSSPLSSEVLHAELPGLATAFDEAAMAVHIQDALVGSKSGVVVERCELDQATYLSRSGVSLRYELTLAAPSGSPTRALVSGRLLAGTGAARTHLEREVLPLVPTLAGRVEVVPFATPAALIPSLGMVVHVFPLDGELPTLVGATDPVRLAQILDPFLPPAVRADAGPDDRWRVQLVDYGRQGRCTLRYVFGPGTGERAKFAVYGKITADGSGAGADAITTLLRGPAQRWHQFAVPRVMAWVPELQLAVLEEIPGSPTLTDAVKDLARGRGAAPGRPTAVEMVDEAAHIAAAVHRAGASPGRSRRAHDELAWLGARIHELERVSPELGHELRGRYHRTAAMLAAVADGEPATCHGDYTPGQVLFGGPHTGLVDFDSVCQADPALDVGHFLAYLDVAATKAPSGSDVAEQLRHGFLDSYDRAVGLSDAPTRRDRARSYSAVSLLRRVLRSWEKFKPGRVAAAMVLLDDVLERGPW